MSTHSDDQKERPEARLAWQQLASLGDVPSERSFAAIGVFDTAHRGKVLYQWGGLKECTSVVEGSCGQPTCGNTFPVDVSRYRFDTCKWNDVTPEIAPDPIHGTPTGRSFAGYATWQTEPMRKRRQHGCHHNKHHRYSRAKKWLLIYGGVNYQGRFECVSGIPQFFGDLWALDIDQKRWIKLPPHAIDAVTPGARVSPGIAVVGSRLYLFGGLSAQNVILNDLWVYDLRARGPWVQLDPVGPIPEARFNTALVYNRERDLLYIWDGDTRLGGPQPTSNDLWSYDPQTNRWDQLRPDAPFPRQEFAAVASKGDAFLVTQGESENNTVSGLLDVGGQQIPFSGDVGTNATWAIHLDTKVTHSNWEQLFPVRNTPGFRDISYTRDDDFLYIFNGLQLIRIGPASDPTSPIVLVYNRTIWKLDLNAVERLVKLGSCEDNIRCHD